MDISTLGKGAITKPVALRDYRLEGVASAPVLPKNFEIVFGGKIKHQNGSSSCVSQATSYYAEVLNFIETGTWVELSPKFLYAQCFVGGGGSLIKDNMSLMIGDGIATEDVLSSYENGNPPSEAFITRKQDITPEIYDNAATYLSKSYYTWDNTSIDLYKQAIVQGNGCVVASWGNNYCWGQGVKDGVILLPDNRNQMTWQHGIFLTGFFTISDADDELVKQGLMTMDEARKRYETGVSV